MPRKRDSSAMSNESGGRRKAARREASGSSGTSSSQCESGSGSALLACAASLRDKLGENEFEKKTKAALEVIQTGPLDMSSATSLVQLYGDALQWARPPRPFPVPILVPFARSRAFRRICCSFGS